MPVSPTWTAEQAALVAQFLQLIVDDIWRVHGDAIQQLLLWKAETQQQLDLPITDEHGDVHLF